MKRALPFVLVGGAALLFCLGVAALAANFFLPKPGPVDLARWTHPHDLVEWKKIAPASALARLGGFNVSQAIDESLQQGDWESALATLTFSPELSDATRAGNLLTLGSRYAAAKQTAKAAWTYTYAADLAVTSPLPADPVRAGILLQAAQGLAGIDLKAAARSALDQSFLVVEYSPSIPRDSRARLYAQIADLYGQFGVKNLADQARQRSEQADTETGDEPAASPHRPYRLESGDMPKSDELQASTKARVTAARLLIDQLNLHPAKTEKDLPDNLIRDLGDRLFEEDQIREKYYTDSQSTDPSVEVALLRDRAQWLSLKLRVGLRGFGLSIVPEWESDADSISTELSDTYDRIFQLSEDAAGKAEQPDEADNRMEDVLRGELVAARWGFYNADENELRSRLGEVESRLNDSQASGLRLDSYLRDKNAFYILVPADMFGQGDKALPK
ncbi:MAG: hypothetical protein ACM3JD_07650 [Rudaea sp.]